MPKIYQVRASAFLLIRRFMTLFAPQVACSFSSNESNSSKRRPYRGCGCQGNHLVCRAGAPNRLTASSHKPLLSLQSSRSRK